MVERSASTNAFLGVEPDHLVQQVHRRAVTPLQHLLLQLLRTGLPLGLTVAPLLTLLQQLLVRLRRTQTAEDLEDLVDL